MIVLTGDVHHASMRTRDQRYLTGTEPESALRFAEIAAAQDVRVTLFVTGRAVAEEPAVLRRTQELGNVELGGHGYNARHPRWLYRTSHRLLGLGNGPAWFQEREIRRTIAVCLDTLGVRIRSWRDHGYYRDRNTYRLLERNGIGTVSDEVGPDPLGPSMVGADLCSLPVNTPPDHDHIVHGDVGARASAGTRLARSRFSPVLLSAAEWLAQVRETALRIIEQGGVATILAHPACMQIADGYDTFERLCAFVAEHDNAFASDVPRP